MRRATLTALLLVSACFDKQDTGSSDGWGGDDGHGSDDDSDGGGDTDTEHTGDSGGSGEDSGEDTDHDSGGGSGGDSGGGSSDCADFEAGPSVWTLPTGFPAGSLETLTDVDGEDPVWSLIDLEGDDDPDLVVTRWDDLGISGLGATQWLIYKNSGSGFSTASTWTLPSGFPGGSLYSITDTDGEDPVWALLDLDGGGAPDLVVSRWDDLGISALGRTEWLVYPNTGTGFDSAETWSLPSGFPTASLYSVTDTDGEDPVWSLADLDGDGDVDLVVTRWDDLGISALGATQWLVYPNTGSGFGSATTWDLPTGFPAKSLESITDIDGEDPVWSLLDLDADGRVDLVVTRWDDLGLSALGKTEWLVYKNTGSGFSTASTWSLPSGFPLESLYSATDVDGDDPSWALVDLSGDGGVDLVVTRWDDLGITALGATQWLRYPNTGSGFASATTWELPTGFPSGSLEALTDVDGDDPSWALLDLDGGAVDLVVSRWDDLGISELGATEWLVYDNQCGDR